MIPKEKLKKISDVIWEIPKSYRPDMNVPARIFATEKMLEGIFGDRSIEQLVNVSTLQGIVGCTYAMPDAHEGCGFPIGGVAAFDPDDNGVVSAGGVGFDISCGVRTLVTSLAAIDLKGIVSYCWPLSVNNLVVMLSGHVGVLLLGAFRPESEVGVYRVYLYLVLLVVLVRASFVQIYKPVAAGLVSAGDRAGVTELHKRVSKWMLVAGSFVGLVILLMGDDLLGILVPESYRIAVSALLLLAGARTVVAALGPQGMTLEAFGNTRFSMLNALLMLGVNIVLGRMLIPSHGVFGAAAAVASAVTVVACAELIEVYALHRLHPFSSAYFRSLAAALRAH